jgi:hypothetical protein
MTPRWLAWIDQFQIDRGDAKNPDYCWGRAFLDTVIMWCARDPPDEAAGRHWNGVVGLEIDAAVHPPNPRQHQTQSIGCLAVLGAHVARIPFHQDDVRTRLIQLAE